MTDTKTERRRRRSASIKKERTLKTTTRDTT